MKVLNEDEKLFFISGVLFKDENPTAFDKFVKYLKNFLICFALGYSMFTSSAVYILHHPDDTIGVLNALLNLLTGWYSVVMYIELFTHAQNIKRLHRELQTIIHSGM